MKRVISKLQLFMLLMMFMFSFSTTVFATDLDSIGNGDSNETTQQSGSGDENGSITDYLKGYTPVTDENMKSAQRYANPITNLLGVATGFLVVVVSGAIFVVTALDLIYIALPFTRSLLNPQQSQGGGMGMSPMGGMGGAQPQQEYGLRRRWVSDEAVSCVSQCNPQTQGGGMGMSPMGGMGMSPMGGMGMSPMGGMGGMGGAQPQPTKSVITMYLKKRAFFLVIFAVATILLTSSIFTDCGINLAQLSFKLIDKFNNMISGINV